MTRRGAPLGGDRPPTEGRNAGDGQLQHRIDPDYSALAARAPPPPNEETGLGWGRGGGAGKEKDLKGPSDVSLDGGNDGEHHWQHKRQPQHEKWTFRRCPSPG